MPLLTLAWRRFYRFKHPNRLFKPIGCIGLLVSASMASAAFAEHRHIKLANNLFYSAEETLWIQAIHSWENDNPSLALNLVGSLKQLASNFGLAEITEQAIQANPTLNEDQIVEQVILSQPMDEAVKQEFEQRWNYLSAPIGKGVYPASIMQLSKREQHVMVVDLTRNRLYLFENREGKPKLVYDFYAGIGSKGFGKQVEGDHKTPVGVYFVVDYLEDRNLDELYGIGAFPLNYPNALDKLNNRSGSGIWVHGVPREKWTRGPWSSRGCVTVTNHAFQTLLKHVDVAKTPVLMLSNINWVSNNDSSDMVASLTEWISDWSSLDNERYLSHYSADFRHGDMDLDSWKSYKKAVNSNKKWVNISIDQVSVFYDSDEDIVITNFQQEYESNNYSSQDIKRIYWRKENGRWKILLEESV